MNFEKIIQSIVKVASSDWDDLSYEYQKDYLLHHPESKRRITAKQPHREPADLWEEQFAPLPKEKQKAIVESVTKRVQQALANPQFSF